MENKVINRQGEGFIENEYVAFWKEQGIVFQVYKPGLRHLSLQVAKAVVSTRKEFSKNRPPMSILIDHGDSHTADTSAIDYFIRADDTSDILMGAFCTHTYNQWIRVRLFLLFAGYRHPFPTKVFKTRETGIAWLQHMQTQAQAQLRWHKLSKNKAG